MVAQICYQNRGPERQAAMGAGHGVHIEGFAAGGRLTLEGASVPGSSSGLVPVAMMGNGGCSLLGGLRAFWLS